MRKLLAGRRRWLVAVAFGLVVLSAVITGLLVSRIPQQAVKPQPSATASAKPTPSSSPISTATATATATASPSRSVPATPTPTPTATPRPTPTPTPGRSLPASMQGVEWGRLPTSRRIVALTFDAGSGDQGLAKILGVLQSRNVPGTFFLTGQFIQTYPDDARAIASYPMHSIGNHTVDHPDLTTLTDAQIRAEILGAEQSILNSTGREPWPLFRFPYGARNQHTIAVANSLGYGDIYWTVDTLGWEGSRAVNGSGGGQSVASVTQKALNGATPGEIILMHIGAAPDGTTLDADALAGIIDGLRAKGYGFVAIWDFIYGLS